MSAFHEKYGHWAVLAGAAEGLGEAYSVALAGRGLNLIMVDHQKEKMGKLASRLEKEFAVQTEQVHLDLADPGAADSIMEVVRQRGCRLLIYNAAYSRVNGFLETDAEALDSYIDINCRTPLRLVHSFAGRLAGTGQSGGIMLMSSLAGLIGMQLVAPYAATKAFTWNLAEALHHEFSGHRIDIMACVAGATATPAYLATDPQYGWPKPSVLDPAFVANAALNQLGSKVRYIPGFSNRLNYFILTRLMPRKMASKVANDTMAKMYGKGTTNQ